METNELIKLLKDDVSAFNEWRKVNPEHEITFTEKNLCCTDLRGANLRGATLLGADLRCANLRYSNLRYAKLIGANLSDVELRSADLYEADLSNANLSGVNFSSAHLYSTDLRGADLFGSDLCGTDLHNAKFDFVKLQSGYEVYIHSGYMQIGCERHSIYEWKSFSDFDISKMDKDALEWWKENKKILFNIIKEKGFDR